MRKREEGKPSGGIFTASQEVNNGLCSSSKKRPAGMGDRLWSLILGQASAGDGTEPRRRRGSPQQEPGQVTMCKMDDHVRMMRI
jgi:hypothetical protein